MGYLGISVELAVGLSFEGNFVEGEISENAVDVVEMAGCRD